MLTDILAREMVPDPTPTLTPGRWDMALPGDIIIEFLVTDRRVTDVCLVQRRIRDEHGARVVRGRETSDPWLASIPRTVPGLVEWAYSRYCEPQWRRLR